jgi:chorismate mutase/prephenate dehydratase
VQDFDDAHTHFLLIKRRADPDEADTLSSKKTVVFQFVPSSIGAGVLADTLDILRDNGINMTSLITRPIKGAVNQYTFVIAVENSPELPAVLAEIRSSGANLKVQGGY